MYFTNSGFQLIEVEGGDSSESRDEERLLRAQAKRCEQDVEAALISAKNAEIRQIEPFAVRLECVRL